MKRNYKLIIILLLIVTLKANHKSSLVIVTIFYLSEKYPNSFVIDRVSFVHTDTIIKKGGSFVGIDPVQFSMVVRHVTHN